MVVFALLRFLVFLPAVAGVCLIAYAVFAHARGARVVSVSVGLLGVLVIIGWVVAWLIARLGVAAAVPQAFGEIDPSRTALISMVGYAPYLVVGAAYMLFPTRLGSLALALAPSGFSSVAKEDAAVSTWVLGLRVFGIYMAAFAAAMMVLNSGILFGM